MPPIPTPETIGLNQTHLWGDDVKKRWGLRSKLWLEFEGVPVIGDGRMKMLRSIHSGGSIKRAAVETGISYRRMRGAIHEMENTIGYPLVKIQRVGGAGGGAELTPAALALMDTYKKLSAGFQQDADARFDAVRDFFVSANGNIRHSVDLGDDTP
jgi:molybdate transport system regulatory protein